MLISESMPKFGTLSKTLSFCTYLCNIAILNSRRWMGGCEEDGLDDHVIM